MSKSEEPNRPERNSTPDLNDDELTEALGSMGLLPPETPDEVRYAEARMDERSVVLPASLQRFGRDPSVEATADGGPANPRPENVVPLRPATKTGSVWPYGVGFALGAAAASIVWLANPGEPDLGPTVGGASSELTDVPPPPEEKRQLNVETPCQRCCAGARCPTAGDYLLSCASGRDCIGCSPADGKNAYKIRISALGLNDAGRRWATERGGVSDLQVCADIRGRSLGCRSATEQPTDLVEWASLPVATTSSQLVGGLRVFLIANTEKTQPVLEPLASWSSAVTVSPETLCRGVAARIALPNGEVIGRVSAFFDDTYFLELGRAGTVKELLALEGSFEIQGGRANIYETTKAGAERFALTVGPTTRARADALRWQLLDQGYDSEITFGHDHEGGPRPR